MGQQTITINGIIYDSVTGLPVTSPAATPVAAEPAPAVVKKAHALAKPSQTIHRATQKSQTLNRRIVQKAPAHQVITGKRRVVGRPDVIRSTDIKKFAPHPAGAKPALATVTPKVAAPAPVAHPLAAKAHAHMAAKQQAPRAAALKPSHILKQEAIDEAMSKAPAQVPTAPHKPVKSKAKKLATRHLSLVSASLALVLLGGYFTYVNMPSLSVRVAAAQAGINASYPTYRPSGYRLDGPVAYTDGEVNMKFASNSGPQSYAISQKKVNWDSSAVEQDVNQKTAGSYSTSTASGLTIYLYGNNASWVNNGILFTLSGNAPLSSDQIDNIATSM